MPSAGERVLNDGGEPTVRGLLLRSRESLVERRGEQRMREADDVSCELDHVVTECGLEDLLVETRGDELGGGQPRVG